MPRVRATITVTCDGGKCLISLRIQALMAESTPSPLPSTVRINRRGAGTLRRGSGGYLAARAGFGGHILWYQTDPSLVWLPFLRILSLHLGQVPISFSSATQSVHI